MSSQDSIPLTSSELGYLWTGYSINEISMWFLKVFREQASDEDIKNIFSLAIGNAKKIVTRREELLSKEGYPIPVGFSEKDIHLESAPLFKDRFLITYLRIGTSLGLEFHSKGLSLASRDDLHKYYSECLTSSMQMNDSVVKLLLAKGLYWRTPTLPAATTPEYIQKTNYLSGWLGDTRPMNSMEMANLYFILDLTMMIEALCVGFAQTTDSEEIAQLFQKGMTLAKKQYEALAELLNKDDLPIPPHYLAEVTDSKERILSDRIMLTHLAGFLGSLITQYGFSLGSVMKHDLVTTYTTHIGKLGAFSEKLSRFLIEKEWLEKVPGAISSRSK